MLWTLAKVFTNRSDLRTVMLKLPKPLDESKIATSLTNNNNDINSAAYDLLRQWRASQDNERIAYTNICEALKDAEQNFLISKVLQ